jgi:FixJ family two-component response regulator
MSTGTISATKVASVPLVAESPCVFIVDDDSSMRESIEQLVETAGWRQETFGSAQAFLERLRPVGPSCLILDVGLPDINGLEVQKRIASDCSEMPIIFITGRGDVGTTVLAMKAGAVEFLTKPFSGQVLLEAIRSALSRSKWLLGEKHSLTVLQGRYQSLSRRERDVMRLVVQGHLNKHVASALGISEFTVKAYRGRVTRKMAARSLSCLVTAALQLGLDSEGTDELSDLGGRGRPDTVVQSPSA